MTAVLPGGNNTFVPSLEATKGLQVDFSRNPDSFPLNKYIDIVPVEKSVGLYARMTVQEAGRILDSTGKGFMWQDGDDLPDSRGNTEYFEFLPYSTLRQYYGFRIGYKAAKQAAWPIIAQHARIKAQQAMTNRTQYALGLLTTTSNHMTGHYSAVNGGSITTSGKWDESTAARQDIKRCIDYGLGVILKDTLAGVTLDDIKLVMSFDCAKAIAVTQEISDYLKASPAALPRIEGKLGPLGQLGLPTHLYGVELVIENTVKVTSKKGATDARDFVLGRTTPFLIARPGSLSPASVEGNAGTEAAPRFSAATLFSFEDMTVRTKDDEDNRRHEGGVIDDFDIRLTAPHAAFLFTGAVN